MVFKIQEPAGFIPIINLLIIGSSMGLFLYVNSYFMVNISQVVDGTVFDETTETFSCDGYYCDETAYNFMNFYTFYKNCNQQNCQNVACNDYKCADSQSYDVNYYYACQAKCGALINFSTPSSMNTAYILSIISMIFFCTGILLGLVFGILFTVCSEGLLCEEKTSLYLMFIWPRLKYFYFRRR